MADIEAKAKVVLMMRMVIWLVIGKSVEIAFDAINIKMIKMIMVVIRVVIRIILSNVHRRQGFGDQNAIDDANWDLAVLLQQEGQNAVPDGDVGGDELVDDTRNQW